MSIWAFQLSTFIMGLAFLLPFFIWESVTTPAVEFYAKIVGSIFYVGIFASLAAFVLWNKAIVLVGPSRAGMVYYTMPLFSGVLATIFLGEAVGIFHLYSVLLIVPGILIANYDPK